jgi:hypothetical protein
MLRLIPWNLKIYRRPRRNAAHVFSRKNTCNNICCIKYLDFTEHEIQQHCSYRKKNLETSDLSEVLITTKLHEKNANSV